MHTSVCLHTSTEVCRAHFLKKECPHTIGVQEEKCGQHAITFTVYTLILMNKLVGCVLAAARDYIDVSTLALAL